MRKKDLETGMRVELRNGDILLVVRDVYSMITGNEIIFVNEDKIYFLRKYHKDLTSRLTESQDVIRVYSINTDLDNYKNSDFLNLEVRHLIWEREKPKSYLRHRYLFNETTNYLNYDKSDREYFIGNSYEYGNFKTKFTLAEIDEIKENFDTDLKDFELIEVEEDE